MRMLTMRVKVHPRLPQQFHTPHPASRPLGLQHAGIQARQGPPACPGRGKASQPKTASLHPGLLLAHRRFILMRAGGPLEGPAARGVGGRPGAEAVLVAAWALPHLEASELVWIPHRSWHAFPRFSGSLWALLYNDAESQKLQLLPESV